MTTLHRLPHWVFFFGKQARAKRRDDKCFAPAWTTERYGYDVVFFDEEKALRWLDKHASECSTALREEHIPTHATTHIVENWPSTHSRRLHDKKQRIAKQMKSSPSEYLAYHALNFAFSTSDTALALQVADWARASPQRWFRPDAMANYYYEERDGPFKEPGNAGENLCLFARLFEGLHVLEWFFQHAPDLKAILQEQSTWAQLLDTMHESPTQFTLPSVASVNFHAEAHNRTFQHWPLVASQCFGHRVSPVSPKRQRLVRHLYDTLQAHVHNPAAQCYYLRQAKAQGTSVWGSAMKNKISNNAVMAFAYMLLHKGLGIPIFSVHACQLIAVNHQTKDDIDFYHAAEKIFDNTWTPPLDDLFENHPLDSTLFE